MEFLSNLKDARLHFKTLPIHDSFKQSKGTFIGTLGYLEHNAKGKITLISGCF